MVYVDPDPEVGSPPSAAGWTEASQDSRSGQSEEPRTPVPSADVEQPNDTHEPAGAHSPRADSQGELPHASQLASGTGLAPASDHTGTDSYDGVETAASAEEALGAGEAGAVREATGGGDPTGAAAGLQGQGGLTETAGTAERPTDRSNDPSSERAPWAEPALPMAWPPGMAPPDHVRRSVPVDEDLQDSEFSPQPDPTWPRLFAQSQDHANRGAGESQEDSQTGRPQERASGHRAESSEDLQLSRQQSGAARSDDDSESSSEDSAQPGSAAVVGATGAGPAGDAGIGANTAESLAATQGSATAYGSATAHGPAAPDHGRRSEAGPASLSGGANNPRVPEGASEPTGQGSVIDVTGSADSPGGRNQHPGPAAGAQTASAGLGAAAPATHGGVGEGGHANISTVTSPGEAGEVDLRDAPPSPRSDVSRETSADGGEEMDPGHQDEVVEDEAAIAVRDAVTRAAVEAGVDVSRETEGHATGLAIDDLPQEATIDSESAARNARVTFRIQRDPSNGTRRVVAVANQKGGVGKSTTAVNIGAYLALAGARVLVIDLDPQGNASTGLGLDHRDIEPSIYDVLTGEAAPAAAIRATGVANLHVLPSTIDLAGAEVELVSAMSRETRLRRALQSVDHQYDTILIDCPPSLGLLTVNALAAADELLIPIQCEYYALEGLGQLLRNVELVRANLNPELRIGGIVLTMYDGRTRLALQVVDEVRKHFTDIVYQTVVPRSIRLSEAPGYGLPIALYDPLSRGGIAYRDLTFELAERSGLLAPNGEGAS